RQNPMKTTRPASGARAVALGLLVVEQGEALERGADARLRFVDLRSCGGVAGLISRMCRGGERRVRGARLLEGSDQRGMRLSRWGGWFQRRKRCSRVGESLRGTRGKSLYCRRRRAAGHF